NPLAVGVLFSLRGRGGACLPAALPNLCGCGSCMWRRGPGCMCIDTERPGPWGQVHGALPNHPAAVVLSGFIRSPCLFPSTVSHGTAVGRGRRGGWGYTYTVADALYRSVLPRDMLL